MTPRDSSTSWVPDGNLLHFTVRKLSRGPLTRNSHSYSHIAETSLGTRVQAQRRINRIATGISPCLLARYYSGRVTLQPCESSLSVVCREHSHRSPAIRWFLSALGLPYTCISQSLVSPNTLVCCGKTIICH